MIFLHEEKKDDRGKKSDKLILKIENYFQKKIAQYWQKYYQQKKRLSGIRTQKWSIIFCLYIVIIILIYWLFIPYADQVLESEITPTNIDQIGALLLTVGGALIGATAIAFSLIMFAMQVNIERLPHGLFRKLSADLKLISTFTVVVLLAIGIASSSIIFDKHGVASVGIGVCIAISYFFAFLIVAYRRALKLINPIEQLSIITTNSKKCLENWTKRARRSIPNIRERGQDGKDQYPLSKDGMERMFLFSRHPEWTKEAEGYIAYCISFFQTYCKQGDYEVSIKALESSIIINKFYIESLNNTFPNDLILISNMLSKDRLTNFTLEKLKQSLRAGIAKRDEEQIIQVIHILIELTKLYMTINYQPVRSKKTHAELSLAYLANGIEAAIPYGMPDVLMEGIRAMGDIGVLFVDAEINIVLPEISYRINKIGKDCVKYVNCWPVVLTAAKELGDLICGLLREHTSENDFGFAIRKIIQYSNELIVGFLDVPDSPFENTHGYYLGSYHILLSQHISSIAESIWMADREDPKVSVLIRHVSIWIEQSFQNEPANFLLILQKRSTLTPHVMNLLTQQASSLLLISSADACPNPYRERLRDFAHRMMSILSFAAEKEDLVGLAEGLQLTDRFFSIASYAIDRAGPKDAQPFSHILLSWAFTAGLFRKHMDILKRSCYGLACLNIKMGFDKKNLLAEIEQKVKNRGIKDRSNLKPVAKRIRKAATNPDLSGGSYQSIEVEMTKVNLSKLRELLIGIADVLESEPS